MGPALPVSKESPRKRESLIGHCLKITRLVLRPIPARDFHADFMSFFVTFVLIIIV